MGQSKRKRVARRPKLMRLLATGMTVVEIAGKLGLAERAVYRDLLEIRNQMQNHPDEAAATAMQIVSLKQENVRMAMADYAIIRSGMMKTDGTPDTSNYRSLAMQIRTLREVIDSAEETYARLGLVPAAPQKVEHTGVIQGAVKVFAIDDSQYREREKTQ